MIPLPTMSLRRVVAVLSGLLGVALLQQFIFIWSHRHCDNRCSKKELQV
jgi:hypothetical protein